MSISSFICTNNSKTMFLRIVHPGGHTELHDRPVLAAEIMFRNPRCCVAYPHVFQQPWAIVAPDTMLMLGQKFYVVPLSTVRKLQRLSPRQSPSPVHDIRNIQFNNEEDDGMISTCCIFRNKIPKQPHDCNKHGRNKRERSENRLDARKVNLDTTDKEKVYTSSSNTGFCDTNRLARKRTQEFAGDGTRGSPRRLWSSEHWQPSLESISEE